MLALVWRRVDDVLRFVYVLIALVGKPLAKFGRLGEYDRSHAPKPLLYYVAYPLLFPYWLFEPTVAPWP